MTTISSPGASVAPIDPPDVERERRHVVAELDLVRAPGTEEVGDGRVCLVDDRVRRLARREGAAGVGVRVRQVVADGIDDALRDLGAAGTVEERDGPAVLFAPQGWEFGAERLDVESGHRLSRP